jgi:hypothetical protein
MKAIEHRFCAIQHGAFQLFLVFIIAVGFMPLVAVAEPIPSSAVWRAMSDSEKVAHGNLYFAGCKVESLKGPAETRGVIYNVVQGRCLGHTFTREGTGYPNACIFGTYDDPDLGGAAWTVYNCNYDGKEISAVSFDANHQQIDVTKLPRHAEWIKQQRLMEAEGKKLFAGCTTSMGTPLSTKVNVEGRCLGHTFSRSGVGPVDLACQFRKDGGGDRQPPVWYVSECNYDGQRVDDVAFNGNTGQQIGVPRVHYSGVPTLTVAPTSPTFNSAQADKERKVAEYKQAHQRDAMQICPEGARPLSAVTAKEPTIYGLAINMPMPCLQFCTDEPTQQKASMCALGTKPSNWGTQQTAVKLNPDKYNFLDNFVTGNPILEEVGGKIVGIRFVNISQDHEDKVVKMLGAKFGKYTHDDSAYYWTAPTLSVRYGPSDDISKAGFLLGMVFGPTDDNPIIGTITVYTPEVRKRVNAYEASEAEKNKTQGF